MKQIEKLMQLFKELQNTYQSASQIANISINELLVWYSLTKPEQDSVTQSDICTAWNLPKQTVNSIIANMTKKNFISLEIIAGTKNKKAIHLTETGENFYQKQVAPLFATEQTAFSNMTDSERQQCIILFEKYILLLNQALSEIHAEETK